MNSASAFILATAWLASVNVACYFTFGWGPLTATLMLGLAAMLGLAMARGCGFSPARDASLAMCLAVCGLAAWHGSQFWRYSTDDRTRHFLVDIGSNTLSAGRMALAGGNPYAQRVDTLPKLDGARGVAVDAQGRTTLFGFRYAYGFPYFPAMMLPYLTQESKPASFQHLRNVNLLLLAASAAFAASAAHALAAASMRRFAALIAMLLSLGVAKWGFELFLYGITDIAIAVLLALGAARLAGAHWLSAGALFGTACACKLLPGPFFVFAAFWWIGLNPRGFRFLAAAGVAFLALVLPFFLRDPEAFFSATILFYLSNHAAGDSTSLYFYLPPPLQAPFLAAGATVLLGMAALAPRVARKSLAHALGWGAMMALVFLAFNKMIHLNYLWAFYSPACAAFAALLCGPREIDARVPAAA